MPNPAPIAERRLPASKALRRGVAVREVVVIAFFALFILMILVMWLTGRRDASRRDICMFRQQQVAMAILQAEAANHQFPGYVNDQWANNQWSRESSSLSTEDEAATSDGEKDTRPLPRRATGWVFPMLPYVVEVDPEDPALIGESKNVNYAEMAANDEIARPYRWLYEEYGPDAAGDDAQPLEHISLLICPDDVSPTAPVNQLSWVVNTGMADAKDDGPLPADWTANGVFQDLFHAGAADVPVASASYLAAHDGAANTLLMTENVDAGQWTDSDEALVGFLWNANLADGRPSPGEALLQINQQTGAGDGSTRFARPSSYHVGGVNAVYAGGAAQFLSQDIDWLVFTQLMSSWAEEAKLPGSEDRVPDAYR